MTTNSQNFNRQFGIILSDSSGNALDLSGFRVVFSISKNAVEEPNKAHITVYNLADTTSARIGEKDLGRIVLQAGYEGSVGVLFEGNVIQVTRTKQGADVITSIEAGDGDKAYSYAIVSRSLASGYTQSDVVGEAIRAMTGKGATGSDTTAVNSKTKYPRGRVIFQSARTTAREVARAEDCEWSIQDGKVVFCKREGLLGKGEGFLISPATGMIGSPVVDKDGVTVECCLNPGLRIYEQVKIESRFASGVYKILAVEHSGDTHGNTWSTRIRCGSVTGSNSKKKAKR